MSEILKAPCRECPFRREGLPGWTGAATPQEFLDTTMADHRMPCHLTVDYEAADWKTQAAAAPECAGASIFFANLGKRSRDPHRAPRLPADRAAVFGRPAEFLAFHAPKAHK